MNKYVILQCSLDKSITEINAPCGQFEKQFEKQSDVEYQANSRPMDNWGISVFNQWLKITVDTPTCLKPLQGAFWISFMVECPSTRDIR